MQGGGPGSRPVWRPQSGGRGGGRGQRGGGSSEGLSGRRCERGARQGSTPTEAARRQSTRVAHFPRGGVSGCGQQHTWVWTEQSGGPGGVYRNPTAVNDPSDVGSRPRCPGTRQRQRVTWGGGPGGSDGEHTLWVQTTGGPPKPARRLHTQPTSFYSSPCGSGRQSGEGAGMCVCCCLVAMSCLIP